MKVKIKFQIIRVIVEKIMYIIMVYINIIKNNFKYYNSMHTNPWIEIFCFLRVKKVKVKKKKLERWEKFLKCVLHSIFLIVLSYY